MVISVEPPAFIGAPERLGARIIDNVLVTKTGTELLSRFSRATRLAARHCRPHHRSVGSSYSSVAGFALNH
jgi:hypothetical protein